MKEDEMGGACSSHGRDTKCIHKFSQKTLSLERSGHRWWIILKSSLKKYDMGMWTGFSWLRIGSSAELL
jgi:hypothetical protein